ncbi:MAG: YbaK/EbsC family protein [Suipraeoptans sp.]
MSVEEVKEYLRQFDASDRVMVKEGSSATVEEAAKVVGCEPARIAKSLSFNLDGYTILVVTAGDMKVDNKKFKLHFGSKPHMLKYDEVEECTGFKPGGVCPFGINSNVDVYLDVSLKRFESVYPAAGSDNSMIKLKLDELFEFGRAKDWIDVCK